MNRIFRGISIILFITVILTSVAIAAPIKITPNNREGLSSVEASPAEEAEPNDSFPSANTVQLNTEIRGNLTLYDVDYYKFSLPDDGYIFVNSFHEYSDDSYINFNVTLYNSESDRIYQKSIPANTLVDVNTLQVGLGKGDYYLSITHGSHYYTGAYRFTIFYTKSALWEKELNDSFVSANPIQTNVRIDGAIPKGDKDYFSFNIEEESIVSISVFHDYTDANYNNFSVTLFDYTGKSLLYKEFYAKSLTEEETRQITLEKGNYYLLITNGGGWYFTGCYHFTIKKHLHDYINGVCSGCGARQLSGFNDVKSGVWYFDAVKYVVEHDLFAGTGNGKFAPNDAMTRAMLVSVLWRYEGSPFGYINGFSDVKDGKWYTTAIAWAAAKGVVNGVGQNRFNPDGLITREQLASILFRYAQKKGFDTSGRAGLGGYPDGGKTSSWAKESVQWAVSAGLISGSVISGKTYLDPKGSASRAQVATIIMRFVETVAK